LVVHTKHTTSPCAPQTGHSPRLARGWCRRRCRTPDERDPRNYRLIQEFEESSDTSSFVELALAQYVHPFRIMPGPSRQWFTLSDAAKLDLVTQRRSNLLRTCK